MGRSIGKRPKRSRKAKAAKLRWKNRKEKNNHVQIFQDLNDSMNNLSSQDERVDERCTLSYHC